MPPSSPTTTVRLTSVSIEAMGPSNGFSARLSGLLRSDFVLWRDSDPARLHLGIPLIEAMLTRYAHHEFSP